MLLAKISIANIWALKKNYTHKCIWLKIWRINFKEMKDCSCSLIFTDIQERKTHFSMALAILCPIPNITKAEPCLKSSKKLITVFGITVAHSWSVSRKRELLELFFSIRWRYLMFLRYSHQLVSTMIAPSSKLYNLARKIGRRWGWIFARVFPILSLLMKILKKL